MTRSPRSSAPTARPVHQKVREPRRQHHRLPMHGRKAVARVRQSRSWRNRDSCALSPRANIGWTIPLNSCSCDQRRFRRRDLGIHCALPNARSAKCRGRNPRLVRERACTLVTSAIPKERLCFSHGAALRLHKARAADGNPSTTAHPGEIRAGSLAWAGSCECRPTAS